MDALATGRASTYHLLLVIMVNRFSFVRARNLELRLRLLTYSTRNVQTIAVRLRNAVNEQGLLCLTGGLLRRLLCRLANSILN